MRHPTDGTLRRLVDEPAGVADADREHVKGCAACLAALAVAREDAAATGTAMRVELDTDVDAGWQRLSRSLAVSERQGSAVAAPSRRWRAALRSPVIAGVAVVALLAGAGVAAATNWLQIFHTEQITPIVVPQADLIALPDLSAFGDLDIVEPLALRPVADAAAAQEATGLVVPQVAASPRGVTGAPAYHVSGRISAVFTVSAAKVAQTAAAAGGVMPPPPAGFDGSQFRLVAGPLVAAVWSQDRQWPAMVVARAVAPAVYSSGISFDVARDYLLSMPGLPADLAAKLQSLSIERTTLPLLMQSNGKLKSSTADVNGTPATVFTSRDGVLAGAVWVADGVVNAVAGSLSPDEVLTVARGLRWDR